MYEAHYGLSELPFRIAPDPRFYVEAAPHRAVIRALLDRLGGSEDFTPLVGDFGTGKTTLARRMLEEAVPARHVVAELSHARVAGDEVLDRIAEALGMRRPKALPPMGALLPQFEALARDGRDALLLVDEADSLSVGALNRLRKLCAVRIDGRAALHVVLIGRSLPAALDDLQRVGRPLNIGEVVRLQPLDAAGTHHYILERLRRAGWAGNPVFDPRTTAQIHARCQGTPGRINRLCGRILLHQFMQGRRDVDVALVCAVDELLQSELDGESPPISLPPLEPAGARLAPTLPTAGGNLDLDIKVPAAPGPASLPAPVVPVPVVPVPRPARRGGLLERSGTARVVAAVLLLVCGGVLWESISRIQVHYSTQARFAAAEAAFSRQARATAAQAAASPVVASVLAPAAAPQQAASVSPQTAPTDILAVALRSIDQAPPGAGPADVLRQAGSPDAASAASAAIPDARATRLLPVHLAGTASAIKGVTRELAPAATCRLEGAGAAPCARPQAQ